MAVTLVVPVLLAPAAGAQGDPPVGPPAGPSVDLGAYAGPVRFEAPAGTTFAVAGRGRYVDTLAGVLAGDGDLVLVNELPMDAYVEGIAEMPARWPHEALKSQAVAARTYAWFELEQGRWRSRGYDICATTSCQVFDGRDVVELPVLGARWARAVAETRGEVLTSGGRPILARYFSTSGGSTRNNETVFPSEGPRPYLKAVDDPWDEISPLHQWEVRFPRGGFDAILARGQTLRAGTPVASIELIPASVTGRTDRIRVSSTDGQVAEVSASALRAFVSDVAPELFPGRYPSHRADGRSLPTTLPSSRFAFEITADEVVVHGRGWGHGVGMSQFGAYGRAEDGQTYREILAAYYNGLEPAAPPDLPDRIRVGLDATDDASFAVTADGPFRVVAGGAEVTARALGTWRLTRRPDRTIGLVAPPGYGAPLVVAATSTSRSAPTEVEQVTLETVVNKPVELALVVTDGAGAQVLRRQVGIVEAGRHATSWSLDDADGDPVVPGRYQAGLVAVDEEAAEAGTPVPLEIRGLTVPDDLPSLLGPAPAPSGPVAVGPLAASGLVGVGLGAVVGTVVPLPGRRRRAERGA
ncbi:MAG TPA: SpoIID/LytB domain-containing protein [Nitriliruptorales bacterium]